ncbi:hypothetical protein AHAS_Ahas17G0012500 [Arachis hypogaea]
MYVSLALTRNMDNFQGIFGSAGSIAYKARRCMVDFEYTNQNRVCCIQGLKSLSWSPPEPGAWKLNCDGSVNLGDDCAGFGWVIRDSSSQWLRRDWDIRFELIPREANVVADRLANMGSGGSGADEVHLWHQPPEVVCPLLLLRT